MMSGNFLCCRTSSIPPPASSDEPINREAGGDGHIYRFRGPRKCSERCGVYLSSSPGSKLRAQLTSFIGGPPVILAPAPMAGGSAMKGWPKLDSGCWARRCHRIARPHLSGSKPVRLIRLLPHQLPVRQVTIIASEHCPVRGEKSESGRWASEKQMDSVVGRGPREKASSLESIYATSLARA